MFITIPITWNAAGATDLAGYKIHCRNVKRDTSTVLLAVAGGQAKPLLLGLDVRRRTLYEIGVSAYDVAGNESTTTVLASVYVA